MLIVGLTGGIASGKSSVCEMLKARGAYIVDTDRIARLVVEPGTPGLQELVSSFGKSILFKEGTLDRKRLGDIIFASPEKRKILEAILHPKILAEKNRHVEEIRKTDSRAIVIVDIPLLLELNRQDTVDKVILVYVSPKVQIDRLAKRDGLGIDDALKRLGSQMPIEQKIRFADYVINNEGSLEETEKEVSKVFRKLEDEESKKSAP